MHAARASWPAVARTSSHTVGVAALAARTTGVAPAVAMRTSVRAVHLANTRRLLLASSSMDGGGFVSTFTPQEPITPEMITIEVLEPEPEYHHHHPESHTAKCDADEPSTVWSSSHEPLQRRSQPRTPQSPVSPSSSSGAPGGIDPGLRHLRGKAYWDVTSVDTFAKGKVLNYLRRMGHTDATLFEVVSSRMDGRQVFRARCPLTLPAPHHSYVAEGYGETEKDAELLAAMHAERVCDALGVPLFRLPSSQRKHAEAVRRQGRFAPLPGDPLQPDGTFVPPPLRMVTVDAPAAAELFGVDGAPAGAASSSPPGTPSLFSGIAEAQIVAVGADVAATGDTGNHSPNLGAVGVGFGAASADGARGTTTGSAAVTPPGNAGAAADGEADEDAAYRQMTRAYASTAFLPWLPQHYNTLAASSEGAAPQQSPLSSSSQAVDMPTPGVVAGNTTFDPTEGGMWAMVNVVSTRCSPSKEALVLPCVLDVDAPERLRDHFLQQGIDDKQRLRVAHVVVPGYSTRMYMAEISLMGTTIVARGKAQAKECAVQLAAMHAELLLDFLERPLFPKDDARQARHAEAVAGFGRWATNPLTGDLRNPRPGDPLPLPLKQQVGGDEVWLDQALLRRSNRSIAERIVAVHNDINNLVMDFIEVNPPQELLTEAKEAILHWQRHVAQNPCPELFLCTRMGDYVRVSTILPVPPQFGIRGGNAVGRTIEQATELCCLHAVDTLCALGLPVYSDRPRQVALLEKRRRLGLATVEEMQRLGALGGVTAAAGDAHSAAKRCRGQPRPVYLPGYLVEGANVRPIPHIRDTVRILQLRIPEDFTVCGTGLSDEELIDSGNEARTCVQNYLKQQYTVWAQRLKGHVPLRGNARTRPDPAESREAAATPVGAPGVAAAEDVAYLWNTMLQLSSMPQVPFVYITGYGKQMSVHNIAYLPLVLPGKEEPRSASQTCATNALGGAAGAKKRKKKEAPTQDDGQQHPQATSTGAGGPTESAVASPTTGSVPADALQPTFVLAVGISLKKKDAERACFLHAVEMLKTVGEDVMQKYRAGLPRKRQPTPVTASAAGTGPGAPGVPPGGRLQPVEKAAAPAAPPGVSGVVTASHPTSGTAPSLAAPVFPKPFMNRLMKQFMESGKYYTPPRPRQSKSPFSPF